MIHVCAGTFIVGFVETMYTVIEGDGQVEVCVKLISPEGDIGDKRVLASVFDNTGPGSIPADVAAASKLSLYTLDPVYPLLICMHTLLCYVNLEL